jgi:hypothetical protein
MNIDARIIEEQPTRALLDAVATLEEFILYAVQRAWWAEIPDVEITVSFIKSELGKRGAFNTEE